MQGFSRHMDMQLAMINMQLEAPEFLTFLHHTMMFDIWITEQTSSQLTMANNNFQNNWKKMKTYSLFLQSFFWENKGRFITMQLVTRQKPLIKTNNNQTT